MSIHSNNQLTNAEEFAYLRHALKNGPANQVLEGLSQLANQYREAIEFLKRCYDQPHLTVLSLKAVQLGQWNVEIIQ